jgi:hypothetical protein
MVVLTLLEFLEFQLLRAKAIVGGSPLINLQSLLA